MSATREWRVARSPLQYLSSKVKKDRENIESKNDMRSLHKENFEREKRKAE